MLLSLSKLSLLFLTEGLLRKKWLLAPNHRLHITGLTAGCRTNSTKQESTSCIDKLCGEGPSNISNDLKILSGNSTKSKADRPHPCDYSTHRQTPWTDNDSDGRTHGQTDGRYQVQRVATNSWLFHDRGNPGTLSPCFAVDKDRELTKELPQTVGLIPWKVSSLQVMLSGMKCPAHPQV